MYVATIVLCCIVLYCIILYCPDLPLYNVAIADLDMLVGQQREKLPKKQQSYALHHVK